MESFSYLLRTINNRAVQYSRSDDFTLVNLTVALFAINCFLITATQLVPHVSAHYPLVQSWNSTAAPVILMGLAVVAFVVECGWKSTFYRPTQAILRFVMLSFVLCFVVVLQTFLGQIA